MGEISSEIMNGVIIMAVVALLVFVVWALKSFAIRFKQWAETLTKEQMLKTAIFTPIFFMLVNDWQALCALTVLVVLGAIIVDICCVFKHRDQLGL